MKIGFKGLNIFLIYLIGVALLVFSLRYIKIDQFFEILSKISLHYFFIFLGILSLAFVINTFKWQILLKALGEKIGFFPLFKYSLIGFFFSLITPFMRLGGEPLKIYLLNKKQNVDSSNATASVIADSSIGVFVEIFSAFIVSLIAFSFLSIPLGIKINYFIVQLVIFAIFIFAFLGLLKGKKPISSLIHLVYKMTKIKFLRTICMKFYFSEKQLNLILSKKRKNFFAAIGIAFAFVILRILGFFFGFVSLLHAINFEVLKTSLLGYVSFIFTSLSPIPGSLGTQESGQLLFTGEPASVVFSALIRIFQMSFVLLGLLFIIREKAFFKFLKKKN